MNLSRLVLILGAALLVAACSSAGATPSTPATSASLAPAASSAATRIEVKLTDSMRMEPAEMRVKAGVPITFVVTNSGAIDHEFYLGDEAAQMEHEREMMVSGGMTHDEPEGITLKPGETKELTYAFPATGQSIAGCHVAGHYGAGMKAAITITD